MKTGNCSTSDFECAPSGPAKVSVDGIQVLAIAHLEASDGAEATCVSLSGKHVWSIGRHSISVELLDASGEVWGPISYIHHYSVLEEHVRDGYKWMTSLLESSNTSPPRLDSVAGRGEEDEGAGGEGVHTDSRVMPQWDTLIDLGGWGVVEGRGDDEGSVKRNRRGESERASGGNGHGIFINPCLFRVGRRRAAAEADVGEGPEALSSRYSTTSLRYSTTRLPEARDKSPAERTSLSHSEEEEEEEWYILFREHELKGAGAAGYRMRLDPSVQWFARLEYNLNLHPSTHPTRPASPLPPVTPPAPTSPLSATASWDSTTSRYSIYLLYW